MTKHIEVRRIVIRTPEEYVAAVPEVLAADAFGEPVTVEDGAIVIRSRVFVRKQRRAAA